MTLLPWSHECSAGFTLRGWQSEPSGKPLLHFIHGNGFCGRTYEPMLALLADDFDLWLCDMQGHGDSDHGGAFLGWNHNAELAVEAFVAGCLQFGNVPRFACGHSFGGVLTSLILAEHPLLFERAVLLDPVLFPQGQMLLRNLFGWLLPNPLSEATRKRRTHWQDAEEAFAKLSGRGIFKGWEEAALRAYIQHGMHDVPGQGVTLKCQPSREVEIFDSTPQGLWQALPKIQAPVRLIHGDSTYPFVSQSAERLAKLNGHVSVDVLPGGHCFMQQNPAMTAQQVKGFLLAE